MPGIYLFTPQNAKSSVSLRCRASVLLAGIQVYLCINFIKSKPGCQLKARWHDTWVVCVDIKAKACWYDSPRIRNNAAKERAVILSAFRSEGSPCVAERCLGNFLAKPQKFAGDPSERKALRMTSSFLSALDDKLFSNPSFQHRLQKLPRIRFSRICHILRRPHYHHLPTFIATFRP